MVCPLRIMELADVHTSGDFAAIRRLLRQHPKFEEWYRISVVRYVTDKYAAIVESQLSDLVKRLGSFERALTLYGVEMPKVCDLEQASQRTILCAKHP